MLSFQLTLGFNDFLLSFDSVTKLFEKSCDSMLSESLSVMFKLLKKNGPFQTNEN